jgi:hypothetical protein
MKTVAMMFAGESDIPVNQLGLILDNPPSADSIVVMDAALASAARQERVGMGVSREDLARNVLMALEGAAGERAAVGINARWLKTESERQGASMEVTQQVQAGIIPPDSVVVLERLGYSDSEIVRIQADQRRARGAGVLASLAAQGAQPVNDDKAAADTLRAKFDALGVAIRSGVDPEVAAKQIGLENIKFTGAVPVSLRLPTQDAKALEGGTGPGAGG